jgi:enoyl-CoA hydratase/carnithine racemase
VLPADQLLDRAVEVATELADTLDPKAYAGTLAKTRSEIVDLMTAQIAADRAAVA